MIKIRFLPVVLTATALSFGSAQADIQQGLDAIDQGDYASAADQFTAELEEGNAEGAFYLGRMLELGLGTEANLVDAVQLYQRAVEGDVAAAKNRLGLLFLEGRAPLIQDFVEGARLLCEAADAGDVNGQLNCGLARLEGRGVDQDAKAGFDLVSAASEAGNLAATNVLAELYANGTGVEADDAKAFELFNQTASQGNPVGMFAVGQSYALGVHTERDLKQAHAFFNLAASRGHPEAATAREAVAEQLSESDLREAQSIARNWKSAEVKVPKAALSD